MRLNFYSTNKDFANYEKVLIRSHAKIILSDDIHDDRPLDNANSVATIAYSKIVVKQEEAIPIWLYILSVVIGLAILFVCIIGFWMVRKNETNYVKTSKIFCYKKFTTENNFFYF